MMDGLILIIIFLWLFCGAGLESKLMDDVCDDLVTPKALYNNTKMNIVGCWICFILLGIINPLGFIAKLIVALAVIITNFFKFIFTVGRDD